MTLRILVDLLFFTGTRGGMESYVRNLYGALGTDDLADVQLVGLASTELAHQGAPWFPGELVNSGISSQNPAAWALAEQAVGFQAARLQADVVHCPANFGPAMGPAPVVLTIHDVLAFRFPEYIPANAALIQRLLLRLSARKATRIVTVSHASARDIERYIGVVPAKISVVPPAGAGRRGPDRPRLTRQLFSLGNRMPHKNFPLLLEAIALIDPAIRPQMVISGGPDPDPLRPIVERLGLEPWVRLEGWLSDAEVVRLYAESTLLVFPTLFEGFGLPVLEAMSMGCPVLCSDIPVLHEVAGDAARYVNPHDATAIARAIEHLLAHADERAELAAAGLARASEFSWHRTARETLAVLKDVGAHRPR